MFPVRKAGGTLMGSQLSMEVNAGQDCSIPRSVARSVVRGTSARALRQGRQRQARQRQGRQGRQGQSFVGSLVTAPGGLATSCALMWVAIVRFLANLSG